MDKIKNIIFDLGGVIINLNIPASIQSFENIGFQNFRELYSQSAQIPLFDQFDKGLVSPAVFFQELSLFSSSPIHPTLMEKAWNDMLLDFPAHRMDLLLEMKQKYRCFLLSNTNETHVTSFENILHQSIGSPNLEPYFEKVYYSCRMYKRKPDPEIFEQVLQENNLNPQETVFIDDTLQHVQGALSCGIQAFQLQKGQEIGDLLQELNLNSQV